MHNGSKECKKVNTWLRLLLVCLIGSVAYMLGIVEEDIDGLYSFFGVFSLTILIFAYLDPAWALGLIARPWYEYLSRNHYDIFLATTEKRDESSLHDQ